MTRVYRLVRAERAAEAFSGDGARLFGGHWNPPGFSVVYASASRSLAVLETFVHLTLEARAMRFLLYEIALPVRPKLRHVQEKYRSHMPRGIDSTWEIGRSWFQDGQSLALVVPSVIIPQEANYVLNVRHGQFSQLRISEPEAFSFDERLWAP
ncbi:MAG TPA: RES family NAD+ phosphorylase [Gammaproteobacteria bacterium]|nr:RES family NAD+ phosphorylase [Gammaproteobacteria bacterium]